jgi:hypothetical protein
VKAVKVTRREQREQRIEQRALRLLEVLSAERPCDACTLCCTHLAVEEIGKPAGERCPWLSEEGCTRYETRPKQCQNFYCAYKLGIGPRPDITGIVLVPKHDEEHGAHLIARGPGLPDGRKPGEHLFPPVGMRASP